MKDTKRIKVQFIKNFKGSMVSKSFRKYNIIEVVSIEEHDNYIHYTEKGIHFIPKEYVKEYKH